MYTAVIAKEFKFSKDLLDDYKNPGIDNLHFIGFTHGGGIDMKENNGVFDISILSNKEVNLFNINENNGNNPFVEYLGDDVIIDKCLLTGFIKTNMFPENYCKNKECMQVDNFEKDKLYALYISNVDLNVKQI